MGKRRKVTREIADIIHKSYDALRLDKVKSKEAFKIIQSDILDEFDVEIGLGTIKHYAHQTFDKHNETARKYLQSEKGKEAQRRYHQSEKGKEAIRRYQQSENYKEYQRKYHQSEKSKEYQRRYYQKLTKPHNEEIAMVIDLFTDFDVELGQTEVWEKAGGYFPNIVKSLDGYHEAGVLKKRKEGNKVFYRLNPDSPFLAMANGFFEEKEKEMDERFGRK